MAGSVLQRIKQQKDVEDERWAHSSVAIGDKVYYWGGCRKTSRLTDVTTGHIDVFDPSCSEWTKYPTSGNPPPGLYAYACTQIDNKIYYYGGSFGRGICYTDTLHELCTNSLRWLELSRGTTPFAPMKKYGCKMVTLKINGANKLLLIGGYGVYPEVVKQHPSADYIKSSSDERCCRTNERHIFDLELGEWAWAASTGSVPPPLDSFSLTAVDNTKAVLFGGWNPTSKLSNDVYIASVDEESTIMWEVIKSPLPLSTLPLWPLPRDCHETILLKKDDTSYNLLVSGGLDANRKDSLDSWILKLSHDSKTCSWKKINNDVPNMDRFYHSVSPISVTKDVVWATISGGLQQRQIQKHLTEQQPFSDTILLELEHVEPLGWSLTVVEKCDVRIRYLEKKLEEKNLECNELKKEKEESFGSSSLNTQIVSYLTSSSPSPRIPPTTTSFDTPPQQNNLEESQVNVDREYAIALQKVELEKANNELKESLQLKVHELELLECELHTTKERANTIASELDEKNKEIKAIEGEYERKLEMESANTERAKRIAKVYQQQDVKAYLIDPSEIIELSDSQELGRGAYGYVRVVEFRCTKVAAKSLHQLIYSDYTKNIFHREMSMAIRARHPNLVQFIGAVAESNKLTIISELMCTDLRRLLFQQRLSNVQILEIAKNVASALAYMHLFKPEPIIHRDISSPNVLLEPIGTDRWRAKLSDYGSANFCFYVSNASKLPGNPSYAAPEANFPSQHTPKMDAYSYGVLLMEMYIRQPPGVTHDSRQSQVKNELLSDSTAPPIMVDVIEKCISMDQEERYSMPDIWKILEML